MIVENQKSFVQYTYIRLFYPYKIRNY